jgi:glucose-6-phosphate 1-dehydrogenase
MRLSDGRCGCACLWLRQVLSLVAMEPPVKVSGPDHSDYVRDAKVQVLNCIEPVTVGDVVLGQYVAKGDNPGYLDGACCSNDPPLPLLEPPFTARSPTHS